MLAITFTKDAAAEIRDRVRRALIEEGMDEEALTVDDAWISTIHGMCSRILRAHALELGIDPEFTVLTDTDELMDQAVEHVLGARRRPMPRPSSPLRLRPSTLGIPWRARVGRLAPVPPSKAWCATCWSYRASCRGGMDDVRVARGQADTSALADAYRAALGASKAATEKAQVALDAIDAFEASGKTMEDAVRLMMSCSMPRASKAFPKEQVELLKAEALMRLSISRLPAAVRRSMRWWGLPVLWRRSTVRSRPTSPRSITTTCCVWRTRRCATIRLFELPMRAALRWS